MKFRLFLVACLAIATSVEASAQESWLDEGVVSFDSEFRQDVEGGYFLVGESSWVGERLITDGVPIAGGFQIEEAYRTEKFGSGVAIIIADADGEDSVKVGFVDDEDDRAVGAYLQRITVNADDAESEHVARVWLPIDANEAGSFEIRLHDRRSLTVRSEGEQMEIQLHFDPERVLVQVYCARGWIRFEELALFS